MTKFQLFSALVADSYREPYVIIDGHRGWVRSVQREDGSGRCFNVTIMEAGTGNMLTLFVRTID